MSRARDVANIVQGSVVLNDASADVDFRVESNGQTHKLFVDGGNDVVCLGLSTPETIGGQMPGLQIEGTDYKGGQVSVWRNANDDAGAYLILGKSRGTALNSDTIVQADDDVGIINFIGADGGDRAHPVASIRAAVDGTPGSNDMPGRIEFWTTADGGTTMAEKVRIDDAGNVGILNTSPTSYGNAHELVVGNHSIDDAGITIATTTGSSARFQFADNTSSPFIGAIEYAHNTNAMMFYTNAAKKFEISTNGKFTLTHGGNEDGVVYTNSNDSNGGSHIKLESYRSATGNFWFMQGVSDSDGTPDREFRITGEGEFFSDASAYNTGAGDYAEYFEWKDGNSSSEDRRGYPVVLDSDNKIRKATSDDAKANIIGIVSANPAVVGDNPDSWKGKFVRDDYNGIVKEEYTLTQWEVDAKNSVGADIKETKSYHTDRIPSDVTAPSDAVVKTKDEDGNTLMRRKMNSDYDRSKTWIPRSERKEWDAIGLMGKLFLRKGQPTGDRWIKMRSISDAVEEWLVR